MGCRDIKNCNQQKERDRIGAESYLKAKNRYDIKQYADKIEMELLRK